MYIIFRATLEIYSLEKVYFTFLDETLLDQLSFYKRISKQFNKTI